jgi:hypothetical protein
MDMEFNEQFSPVKSENVLDEEEENISQKVSNLKQVGKISSFGMPL